MRKLALMGLFLIAVACAPREQRIVPDGPLCQAMQKQLDLQKALAHGRQQALFTVFEQRLTPGEREALQWLYAWMPLSDLADYDGQFYLRQVRATLQARAEMPWGSRIPQELFLHFVLPLRVNNENLDSARVVFYDLLKERVSGLSMRQAALEVNHWCHEHVTYRGADMRTSAPLATMVSAIGRCGEESVFTVAALRAVGIPARQVYVPRWAHSDDNHAWVEVWADRVWYFLGACEPDPDLNMGWFKEPVRRAMLVHTRVIGPYSGDEELLDSSPRHREINVLDRYAATRALQVKTVTADGRPLAGADVSFRLYNYAEFYPLARRTSDANGLCSLKTGFGDLLIWAKQGELSGYARARVADADTVEVVLRPFTSRDEVVDLDFSPPLVKPALPDTISEAARARHGRRLAFEDSVRKAYEATFIDSTSCARLADSLGLAPDAVRTFLQKSRGNHREISRFLQEGAAVHKALVLPLLGMISEKDLRDARAAVLLEHLAGASADKAAAQDTLGRDHDFYARYLLNPRVRNEALVAWRRLLADGFTTAFRDSARRDPGLIAEWIREHIKLDETANYCRAPLTPRGVWELRVADALSRDIFFVALCRSLGIPARLDPAFEIPQYYEPAAQKWHSVAWQQALTASPIAALILNAADKFISRPEYWIHFTLARRDEGEYKTLELEGLPFDKGAARVEVPAGDYLLITGTRQQDGQILTRLKFFALAPAEEKTIALEWRREAAALRPLAQLPMAASVFAAATNAMIDLQGLAGKKGLVLAWLDPGREPSQHVLREWQELRALFEQWGGNMVAVVDPEKLDRLKEYQLPAQLRLASDPEEGLLKKIAEQLPGQRLVNHPVLLFADEKGAVLLLNQGYQVGLGDRLLQTIMAAATK